MKGICKDKHASQCPKGYIDWHDWAQKMSKTHDQVICLGCHLYRIWVKNNHRSRKKNETKTKTRE
jgi:hypothetical protein